MVSNDHRVGQKTPPFADAKRRGRNREEANTRKEVNPPDLPCQSNFWKILQSFHLRIYGKIDVDVRILIFYPLDWAARSGRKERTTVPACHISLFATALSSFSSCSR